jgi:hypothetical protein
MTEEEIKAFIYERMSAHPDAKVLSVSVQKYPGEYSVTVWLGQIPTPSIRQYAYELEAELANLGVVCSIIVKSDQEKTFGGVDTLHTSEGPFSYRYLKADPIRDEDVVYLFSLYKGSKTYRFRISLSGTLASMLRMRNKLNKDRILNVYLDKIRGAIAHKILKPDVIEEIMFDSRDLKAFSVD